MLRPFLLAALCIPLIITSCASSVKEETARAYAPIKAVSVLGMKRAHLSRGVLLGSQPDAQSLVMAKERYKTKTVINLRSLAEMKDSQEVHLVLDQGMNYHAIPFKMPETLTDEVFAVARADLNNSENGPIMLHCKSGNRVGAIWYAHLVLDCGISPDAAMTEAEIVGLSKAGHIARAKAYVDGMMAQ